MKPGKSMERLSSCDPELQAAASPLRLWANERKRQSDQEICAILSGLVGSAA